MEVSSWKLGASAVRLKLRCWSIAMNRTTERRPCKTRLTTSDSLSSSLLIKLKLLKPRMSKRIRASQSSSKPKQQQIRIKAPSKCSTRCSTLASLSLKKTEQSLSTRLRTSNILWATIRNTDFRFCNFIYSKLVIIFYISLGISVSLIKSLGRYSSSLLESQLISNARLFFQYILKSFCFLIPRRIRNLLTEVGDLILQVIVIVEQLWANLLMGIPFAGLFILELLGLVAESLLLEHLLESIWIVSLCFMVPLPRLLGFCLPAWFTSSFLLGWIFHHC